MQRLKTQVLFNNKEYIREIDYHPSNLEAQTPSPIISWMRTGDGKEYKAFRLKAVKKKQNQINYLLNQCVGEIGEEILADFLRSRGWIVNKGTPIGDFRAVHEEIKYLIEVKTSRSCETRFFVRQAKNMRRFCKNNRLVPLFYVVILELTKISSKETFNLLEPATTEYRFKVLGIRTFHKKVFSCNTTQRPSLIIRKLMTRPKVEKYPTYFFPI